MNDIKAVVIGCGQMGQRHIQALKNEKFMDISILETNFDILSQVGEKYKILKENRFQDVNDLLTSKKIDLAIIATTAPYHAEYIIKLANSNVKYILCEKPLSVSLKDLQQIKQSIEKNKTCFAINHQIRYMPAFNEVKKILNNHFGLLNTISVSAGNFGLNMNGTHRFEVFRYMFDEIPSKVSAWFEEGNLKNPRGDQFADKSGLLVVESLSGKKMILHASKEHGHGVFSTYTAQYGQVFVDELEGFIYTSCRKKEEKVHPTSRYGQPADIQKIKIPSCDVVESTQKLLKDFIAGHNYPGFDIGEMAIRSSIAAYISNENNHQPIDIDTINDGRTFPWA